MRCAQRNQRLICTRFIVEWRIQSTKKKHENPEKFTACTHKLNRDSGPTSSERKTTNIIPIRIVSSQNVKIIPKNSLHTHEKK